jgi:hypothetical protein
MVDTDFPLSHDGIGEVGRDTDECRGDGNPASGMALVGMGRRPRADSNFEAVRAAIGTALRSLHFDVLREPLPDRIAELLRQLDQPTESSRDTDNA